MAALKTNIKKFAAEKTVDLTLILSMIFLLFLLTPPSFQQGQLIGFSTLAAVLAAYYISSRYVDRKFDRWRVPPMNREETKEFLMLDSFYNTLLIMTAFFLLRPYIDTRLLLLAFGTLLLWKEFRKWNAFIKETAEAQTP